MLNKEGVPWKKKLSLTLGICASVSFGFLTKMQLDSAFKQHNIQNLFKPIADEITKLRNILLTAATVTFAAAQGAKLGDLIADFKGQMALVFKEIDMPKKQMRRFKVYFRLAMGILDSFVYALATAASVIRNHDACSADTALPVKVLGLSMASLVAIFAFGPAFAFNALTSTVHEKNRLCAKERRKEGEANNALIIEGDHHRDGDELVAIRTETTDFDEELGGTDSCLLR